MANFQPFYIGSFEEGRKIADRIEIEVLAPFKDGIPFDGVGDIGGIQSINSDKFSVIKW